MAFNPFDVFRRNQRTLFAILTVFVMFMFVLSFGRGDFFDWLPRWLGSKAQTGEVLATLNGSKVYQSDLYKIETRRLLANQYMTEAAGLASGNLERHIREGMARMSAENRPVVQQFLQVRMNGYISPNIMQRFQFAQMGFGAQPTPDEIFADRESTIAFFTNRLNALVSAPNAKAEDQDFGKSAQYLLDLDVQIMSSTRGLFFSNQPNQTTRDQLEFMLWLKKADQLGITFTKGDLNSLLDSEFWNKMTNADWQTAAESLKQKPIYTPDLLSAALLDEFRVRAAQTAVLGQGHIRGLGTSIPDYDAPYNYFEFYKDQTSPARFGVLSVPSDNYLAKVTAVPTESELRDTFRKYRNMEPTPYLPGVGLREPRKLKLGWLEAKGDEAFYTKAADAMVPQIEAHMKLLAALSSSQGGASLYGLFATAALLSEAD